MTQSSGAVHVYLVAGEESGDLSERSDLDGGEGRVGGGKGGKDRILELVVLGPEDDPAEAATDQRLGGGY